jgi:hypothetical protein
MKTYVSPTAEFLKQPTFPIKFRKSAQPVFGFPGISSSHGIQTEIPYAVG